MDNVSAAAVLEVIRGDSERQPIGISFPWGWTVAGPDKVTTVAGLDKVTNTMAPSVEISRNWRE